MNSLVAVGTGAAFAYSVVATVTPAALARSGVQPNVYFEAVIIIVAFVRGGPRARGPRDTSGIRRRSVGWDNWQPDTATVVLGSDDTAGQGDAARTGSCRAMSFLSDLESVSHWTARVISGRAAVDESM
jgi:Cu+-exporting ATPase